jgi:hypothetical protein
MKAIQVNGPGADFVLVQKEIPQPKEHEVHFRAVIKIGDA